MSIFNETLETLKQERRKCERLYRKNRTELNKLLFLQAIKKCKVAFKEKKSQYIECKVNRNLDSRTKFATANKLLGLKSEPQLPKTWGSPASTANRFVEYFDSKISDIKNSIPTKLNSMNIETKNSPSMANFTELDHVTLTNIISSTSNATSNLDDLPTVWAKKK